MENRTPDQAQKTTLKEFVRKCIRERRLSKQRAAEYQRINQQDSGDNLSGITLSEERVELPEYPGFTFTVQQAQQLREGWRFDLWLA